jgi:hypothetical protein
MPQPTPRPCFACLTDSTGRTFDHAVEVGVCIFMWKGTFDLEDARLGLLMPTIT